MLLLACGVWPAAWLAGLQEEVQLREQDFGGFGGRYTSISPSETHGITKTAQSCCARCSMSCRTPYRGAAAVPCHVVQCAAVCVWCPETFCVLCCIAGNFQHPEKIKADIAERNRFGRFYYRFPDGESGADGETGRGSGLSLCCCVSWQAAATSLQHYRPVVYCTSEEPLWHGLMWRALCPPPAVVPRLQSALLLLFVPQLQCSTASCSPATCPRAVACAAAAVLNRISILEDHLIRDMKARKFGERTSLVLVTHGLTLRVFLMRWFNVRRTTRPPAVHSGLRGNAACWRCKYGRAQRSSA
jgi:hypothetical protein